MTQRLNQTTGQYEIQQPDGSWRPMATEEVVNNSRSTWAGAPPRQQQAPTSGFAALATPEPSREPQATPRLTEYRDNPLQAAELGGITWDAPPTTVGTNIGAAAGRHGANLPQPLDLSGVSILPEDQALIDALTQIQAGIGANVTPPTAPQLPTPPAVEVNPGLEVLANHQQNRSAQVEDLISELRGDIDSRRSAAENKWATLGRWLSDWSATGDLTQAGAAMTRTLQNNQDMRDQLRQETILLTQMGWSQQDALIQAQANLLAGQSAARQATADRVYERDVQQADITAQYENSGYQARTRAAAAQADIAARIAEITRDATGRAREGRNAGLSALTEVPEYSQSAWAALVPDSITDPGARAAVATQMTRQQAESGLFAYIAANQGGGDSTLQFLRQWDPTLRRADLENLTPPQLFYRLNNAAGAQTAYQRNPNLSQMSRFAAPAQ